MEIERKFLVLNTPSSLQLYRYSYITQAYISIEPEIRIRQLDDKYFLTQKSIGSLLRSESEAEISFAEYSDYNKQVIGKPIQKRRYYIPLEGALVAECDIYSNHLDGLMTVEVEFDSEDDAKAFIPPAWFGKELTYDNRYKNKNLALSGIPLDY